MLQVSDLQVNFPTRKGVVQAVNGVSFNLAAGEILGIVGESGSGKSMTLLSLLGLVPKPGEVVGGEVLFRGENLLTMPQEKLRSLRGSTISIIFQDPMTTLNPIFKVGEQIAEVMRTKGIVHDTWFKRRFKPKETEEFRRVVQLLREVGISAPAERFFQYPHQFSGGMQQRALIATALAANPALILADEPTTALDVTVQAQILDLFKEINRVHNTGIIFVTHDLGVAAQFCQKIMVMYAGQMVEFGDTEDVLHNPKHPYTQGLLRSIPHLGDKSHRINPISGQVPDLMQLEETCPFYDRCELRHRTCGVEPAYLYHLAGKRQVRCHLYREEAVE